MSRSLFPTHRVLWMPLHLDWRPATARVKHCCPLMTAALEFECEEHAAPFDCPDTILVYHEPFDEYGAPIRDGGMGYLLIANCPWCGVRLPPSQRDRWFDEVEVGGWPDESIPEGFLTSEWRT